MNSTLRRAAVAAVFVTLACTVTGCVIAPGTGPFDHWGATFSQPPDDLSYWDGDGMTGSPSVRINLGEQRAYFYKGGQLAGVSVISSGREGLGTVTGKFRILEKDRDHKSSLFGDYVDDHGQVIQKEIDTRTDPKPPGAHFDGAEMPFFMRIVGGTGMHKGYLPGYPASHGCIRMPGPMAEAFYNAVSVGTPVTIED